jgi:type I restriction enzyme, S subunit
VTHIRMRYAAQLEPGKSEVSHLPPATPVSFLPMADVGFGGDLRPVTERELQQVYRGYTYLREGDVAIATISPSFQNRKGGLLREAANGICFATTELTVFRPNTGTEPRYLMYVLGSTPFIEGGRATLYGVAGQRRVSTEYLKNFKVWLPPIEQQTRMSDYLDGISRHVSGLVEKNERLAALVDERLQRLRADLLMEGAPGTDPTALLARPACGLPRIKHLVRDKFAGSTPKGKDHWVPRGDPGSVAWLGIGDMEHGRDVTSAGRFLPSERLDQLRLRSFPPGTLLFAMYGATAGKTARLDMEATWNQAILGLVPDTSSVRSDFLYLWLQVAGPAARMLARSNTQDNFNAEQVLNFPIPAFSLEQQDRIIHEVQEATLEAAAVQQRLERQNELLIERRQALITAAVTGQLDVGAAA